MNRDVDESRFFGGGTDTEDNGEVAEVEGGIVLIVDVAMEFVEATGRGRPGAVRVRLYCVLLAAPVITSARFSAASRFSSDSVVGLFRLVDFVAAIVDESSRWFVPVSRIGFWTAFRTRLCFERTGEGLIGFRV